MVKSEMKFSEDLELYVDVSCGELPATKGHLVFKCNQSPCLTIDDGSWNKYFKRNGLHKKENAVIKCTYKNDNYYLYFNDVHYNVFYPKYIVKSEQEYVYSRFYMSIKGLFKFFNGVSGFLLTAGELKKKVEDYFLEVEFHCLGEDYFLKISHDFSIDSKNNETVIFEDAVLCVQRKDGFISLDDAKSLSFKVYNFFSLIFGVGLSVEYISLGGDHNDRMIYSPFYFPSHYVDSDVITYPAKTLITHPSNLTNYDWQLMLNNFFSDENKSEFEDIWTRFVSMHSYKGFWEYEILGYASILDVYSQKLIDEKKGFKISTSKMKLLKDKVTAFAKQESKLLGIDNDDGSKEIVESFYCHIKNFKNTLVPTFKERYTYALNLIDHDFLSIVNFTEENFILIKKIRDSAAHGKPIRTKKDEGDGALNINDVFVLLKKLVIILSCLSFKTLGIDERRFAKMIIHSHNDNKINASLDEMKLDVYCNEARVVRVDADTFTRAKGLFAFDFVVQQNQETGDVKFNNTQLLNIMVDFKKQQEGFFKLDDFCDYVYNHYTPNAIYCVQTVNKVYCMFNEDSICLHNVLWVTYQRDCVTL